jgi:hypothetical protein
VVERTAHNGLVVGSNPTKPRLKYYNEEINSKRYKIIKTKNYLKNNNLFLFFSGINQNSTDWIKIEQKLKNLNLNYYKIFNRTSTQILKNSIFINTEPTINGITFFIKPANSNTTISKKKISNIETLFFLFSYKI